MATVHDLAAFIALIFLVSPILPFSSGDQRGADPTRTLTIINRCNHIVWPAILQNSGSPPIPTSGFSLKSGQSKTLAAPVSSWSGRLWGRTRCSHDDAGKFSCVTGNCGTAAVECSAGRITPPVSVAEFFLNGTAGGLDLYDVSVLDGFNLPMSVTPTSVSTSGGGKCSVSWCYVDLNRRCPTELRMTHKGQTVACKSASSSSDSEYFKNLCPRARVCASDRTSLLSCASLVFEVIFCPSSNQAKNSRSSPVNSRGLNTTNESNSDENGKVKPSQFSIKYLMKKFQEYLVIAVLILVVFITGLILLIIWCCRHNSHFSIAENGHLHCFPITLFRLNA